MLSRRARLAAAVTVPLVGLLVAPTLGPTLGPAQAAASSTLDAHQWRGGLTGISTVSPSHAWAAGTAYGARGGSTGLLLVWNGSQWRRSDLVLPGRASELTAVDARTANDVWAVGSFYPMSSSREVTLIEHWDGSTWHREPAPGPLRTLTSVSADAANDAWAAGYGPRGAVLLHWDGDRWTSARNKACHVCTIPGLHGVTAISPTDAWAVGYTGGGVTTFKTMHWDGVNWRAVPSAQPRGPTIAAELESVSASSATDVWAVGSYVTRDVMFRSFIEHWDGNSWTRLPGPNRHEEGPLLYGVSAVTGSDAWTVGYRLRPARTETEHWNGRRWSDVDSPDPGLLFAVDASSPSNAWAVGDAGRHTLIEHWDGHAWSVS